MQQIHQAIFGYFGFELKKKGKKEEFMSKLD